MSRRPGLTIAVEGIDGAGKSHVSNLVMERLRASGLRIFALDKHRLHFETSFAGRRMDELRQIIWPSEVEPDEDRLGTEFYLFLLAAWFAGLRRVAGPMAADADIILLDGSFHRVIAKAHARAGLDIGWLESLFRTALVPDLVILLDIDPALAWRRRVRFKATELGRWDGRTEDAQAAFTRYQQGIRGVLLQLAAGQGWEVIAQSPDQEAEHVAGLACEAILQRLR